MRDGDDLIRVGMRERVEDDALDDGEDRDVGADGESQGAHRRERERRTAQQAARCLPDLDRRAFHGTRPPSYFEAPLTPAQPCGADTLGPHDRSQPAGFTQPDTCQTREAVAPRLDEASGARLFHRRAVFISQRRRTPRQQRAIDPHHHARCG